MQTLQTFTSDHPIASAVTAASIVTATAYIIISSIQNKKKQARDKRILQKLNQQGPEFQIVRVLEEALKYFNNNNKNTKSTSSSSSFFLRREQISEFFSKNENLVTNELLPIMETRDTVKQILTNFATQCEQLERRRKESFSNENEEHVALLKKLWEIGISNEENEQKDAQPFERTSSKWDKLGFQGQDPATDLRGGGILALDIFTDFVVSNPELVKGMQKHCAQKQKEGSLNWLLIACASINITVQLFGRQFSSSTAGSVDSSNTGGAISWTCPILMAIFRGAAVMEFHPRAKIPDSERTYFAPTLDDYKSGLVRVAFFVRKDDEIDDNELQDAMDDNDDVEACDGLRLVKNTPVDKKGGKRTASTNDWTLFGAVCRVHHHLMRRLFNEWILKEASVMEFERFVQKNVYEPFFSGSLENIDEPILL